MRVEAVDADMMVVKAETDVDRAFLSCFVNQKRTFVIHNHGYKMGESGCTSFAFGWADVRVSPPGKLIKRPHVAWKWRKWTFGFWTDPSNWTAFGIDVGPLEVVWRYEGYRQ